MAITLYHHPYSRAANVVWMLEEAGVPYSLTFVDILAGEQKSAPMVALNPMGKLPVLVDDGLVVTESAAIGLYLADRYAMGRLAPRVEDPIRGTYLRWSLFAPSVIEPGTMAKAALWQYKPGQAGWGTYDEMLQTIESAIEDREYLLGTQFSMADVVFGGTLRFMLKFQMIEPRPAFVSYTDRLAARAAFQIAEACNAEVMAAHGINPG
jgi:glutathione S-transferase